MNSIWMANGNNVSLKADSARRVLPIRLQSKLESPEERSDFEHPDLLAWVQNKQPRLAAAALTILKAWFAAGCPRQDLRAWGSFEAWSNLVRQVVVWVGQPDPAATRLDLPEVDADRELMHLIVAALREVDPRGNGITVNEALKLLVDSSGSYNALEALVSELSNGKPRRRRRWV